MAYCTQCGNRLDPNDKFCGACGARVKIPEPAPEAPVNEEASVFSETQENSETPENMQIAEDEYIPVSGYVPVNEYIPVSGEPEETEETEEKESVYGASLFDDEFYKEPVVDKGNYGAMNRYYKAGRIISIIALVLSLVAAGLSVLSLIFMKAGIQKADIMCCFFCMLICFAGVPLFIIGLVQNKRGFNKRMILLSWIALAITVVAFITLFTVIPKI